MVEVEVLRPITVGILDALNPGAGYNNYDPQKDPVCVYNFGGTVTVMIADAEMVQDLLGQKNSIYDKEGWTMGVFKKLLGHSFLFSPADDDWKAKRKACAHAFYKERLVHMIEIFKEKLEEHCLQWIDEIKASEGGYTEIDLPKVYRMMFTRNIIHISFGEDLSQQEIEIWYARDSDRPRELTLTKMKFGEALEAVGAQIVVVSVGLKLGNPLYRVIFSTTGKSVSLTKVERQIDENCRRIRAFIAEYIAKRRAG